MERGGWRGVDKTPKENTIKHDHLNTHTLTSTFHYNRCTDTQAHWQKLSRLDEADFAVMP